MANFNSVVLVGRLTRDPELRYTPTGDAVCTFGIAINRKWTPAGGEQKEETVFLDIEAWKRLGETCGTHLKKGREVLVHGSVRQEKWENDRTGKKGTKTRIAAQAVQFLGPKPDGEPGSEG